MLSENHPRFNFYSARNDSDSFPDPFLIYRIDSAQDEDVVDEIEQFINNFTKHRFRYDQHARHPEVLHGHVDIFHAELSYVPQASVSLPRIDLVHDACPIEFRLQNYSKEQRAFLDDQMSKLEPSGMMYSNPSD